MYCKRQEGRTYNAYMSISMKMVCLCTIAKIKAKAILEAVACSLKGTKDRFDHSLLSECALVTLWLLKMFLIQDLMLIL